MLLPAFALLMTSVGCGGLLHQSVKAQRAVEDKGYPVDRASVGVKSGEKTVVVYTEKKTNKEEKAEIKEAVREVIPDATKVKVKKASESGNEPRENTGPRENK